MVLIIIALALLQGFCEFLPVSSSGHLALAQACFGLTEPEIIVDLVLHLGTLAAVIYYYRQTLLTLVIELQYLPKAAVSLIKFSFYYKTHPDFRLGILIIGACFPTAAVGLFFNDFFISLFASIPAVGLALIITSAVLTLTSLAKPGGRTVAQMTIVDALVIGLVQGLAIAPGLSRSGLTIGAALLLGLDRDLAAKFSFILSIPAIVGGLLLTAGTGSGSSFGPSLLLVGVLISAGSGYLALKLLTALIDKGRFHLFAPWCFLVGLAALYWHWAIR
jgi:undecaprenyl-diphosphatase